ncbi:DNA-3-methyladenine glycosylase family protein [Paenibacillus pasadenensis]|uniref:DNA-3-methyladenine glycosylase II n=1 Tax=Paenibacillus pasadenensis TaxID=217090 RepID=A0A2N5N246_9BACL|nr:DNA-3-methyladenine glycosylase [Paenibacillus pasadenensis]PLT44417.1 DNA-3-methyladenine glycosylase II [Paenibacillus pasadenensis]
METTDRNGAAQEEASRLRIELPELFSWPAVLGYLARSSDEALYRVDGSEVTKLFEREGELALVRFRCRDDVHALEAEFVPIGTDASEPEPAAPAAGRAGPTSARSIGGLPATASAADSSPSAAPSAAAAAPAALSAAHPASEPAPEDPASGLPPAAPVAPTSAAEPSAARPALEPADPPAPAAARPSPAMQAHVRRYAEEWFDLDRDLAPFYRLAAADPLLKEAAETFRGLRMVGIPDLFEAACWGIIGQQINLPFAYALKKRFTESFGRSVRHGGWTYWCFPKPAAVAALEPSDIAALQMTTRKSEYLIGVARHVAAGELDKRELAAAGWSAAEKRLTAVRGIGPWTAHYVMMRCLRMAEALPAADVGLQHAIRVQAGLERKPTEPEVREHARAWAGWEAYATFYLWRTLY